MSNHSYGCASFDYKPCDCSFRRDHANPPGLKCADCGGAIGHHELWYRRPDGKARCNTCENAETCAKCGRSWREHGWEKKWTEAGWVKTLTGCPRDQAPQ
jgi:hypothetical protein